MKKKPSRGPMASSSGVMSRAPVAQSRSKRTGVPSTSTMLNGTCIRHREYFTDVVSAGVGFQVFSYPIQPAIPNMFPWLSKTAAMYDNYEFKRLQFEYETQAATSSTGTVMMAVDFDALDVAPESKTDLLSMKSAVRSAPWTPSQLTVSSGDITPKVKFTRVGAVASSDLKTYDAGNLQVGLQGIAAGTIGELYVTYDVCLTKPQNAQSVGGSVDVPAAGLDQAHLWGTGALVVDGPMPFTRTSSGVATFQQTWEGLITVDVIGTVMSAFADITSTANIQLEMELFNAAATRGVAILRVQAAAGQTFNFGLTATTVTAVFYHVASAGFTNLA